MFQSLTFTAKYILALSLIALLSTLAYFNLNHIINKQSNDGEIINISGKQRMLSQQIAFFAIKDDNKELNEKIDSLEFGHNFLIAVSMSKKLENIYFKKPIELDKRVREYIKHSRLVHNEKSMHSLMYVLENSQLLLKDLDKAVSLYQKESEQKVSKLKDIELLILIFTIIILIFEAFFIFDPANKKINDKTQELIDEKNFSDTITESNTNAIISVGSDFKVRTYNKSAENMFGYTKEEILGSDSLLKIVPDIYKNAHKMGLAQFFRTGTFKFDSKVLELTAVRKNNEHFPIRISFGSNENKNDRIVVANIQDITDEKDKDSKILEQSRYAAMGEMIGNIAHQWRQPLSQVSGLFFDIESAYDYKELDKQYLHNRVDEANNLIEYMSKTIDDFRNFFNPNTTQETFLIKDAVWGANNIIKSTLAFHSINLIIEINENTKITGYKNEYSQAVLNIISNAKDILIERKIKNPCIKVSMDSTHKKLLIEDNAGGIDKTIIEKIFDPYFTTKYEYGTGIGLYMTKLIIESKMNGSINVKNSKQGAVFTIEI